MKVQVTGHGIISSDSTLKNIDQNSSVIEASMAVNYKYSSETEEKTDYHKLVIWNRPKLAEYLKKGREIKLITGELCYDKMPINDGDKEVKMYYINVNRLELGRAPKGQEEKEIPVVEDTIG